MSKRLCLSMCVFSFSMSVFANAPVATFSLSSSGPSHNPDVIVVTPSNAIAMNTPPTSAPTQSSPTAISTQVPQVVDSKAVLASLTPEQRLMRLENQVQYLNSSSNQVNNLITQIDALRGQLEDLNHQIAEQQKQMDALNKRLAAAIAPTSSSTPNTDSQATSSKTAAVVPQPSTAEQTAYQNAYNLMANKQYTGAIQSFNTFLNKYPKSTLADNAHYWLGDLYLAQGQPDNASKQYRIVINDQNATKRPDAMVKLGTILSAYGDNQHAKELFQNVLQQYPGTTAATQAKQKLKSLQ